MERCFILRSRPNYVNSVQENWHKIKSRKITTFLYLNFSDMSYDFYFLEAWMYNNSPKKKKLPPPALTIILAKNNKCSIHTHTLEIAPIPHNVPHLFVVDEHKWPSYMLRMLVFLLLTWIVNVFVRSPTFAQQCIRGLNLQ